MVLDEQRRGAKRNGFLPCIIHHSVEQPQSYDSMINSMVQKEETHSTIHKGQAHKTEDASTVCQNNPQTSTSQYNRKSFKCGSFKHGTNRACSSHFLQKYGKLLSQMPVQIAVALLTVTLLVLSIYGNIQLKQEFDPWLFMHPDHSIRTWRDANNHAFPEKGENVILFFEGPHWQNGQQDSMDIAKIGGLLHKLKNQQDIITKLDSWYLQFEEYYQANFQYSSDYHGTPLSGLRSDDFNKRLIQFLYSADGLRYQYSFDFDDVLECGGVLPGIQVHMMQMDHILIEHSAEGNSRHILNRRFSNSYKLYPMIWLYNVHFV